MPAKATEQQEAIIHITKEQFTFVELQPRSLAEYNHNHEHMISLAESINEKGILQPPLAIPDPNNPGHYIIVAGRSRTIAAFDMLGMSSIPVVVKNLNETEALQAAFEENAVRHSVNPIDEALFIFQMQEKHGKDAVASMRGIAQRTLQQYRKIGAVLHALRPEHIDQIRKKNYSVSVLRRLESVRVGTNQDLLWKRVNDAFLGKKKTNNKTIELHGHINGQEISGKAEMKPRTTTISLKGSPEDIEPIIHTIIKSLQDTKPESNIEIETKPKNWLARLFGR